MNSNICIVLVAWDRNSLLCAEQGKSEQQGWGERGHLWPPPGLAPVPSPNLQGSRFLRKPSVVLLIQGFTVRLRSPYLWFAQDSLCLSTFSYFTFQVSLSLLLFKMANSYSDQLLLLLLINTCITDSKHTASMITDEFAPHFWLSQWGEAHYYSLMPQNPGFLDMSC